MDLAVISDTLKGIVLEIAPSCSESDISMDTAFIEDLLFDSLMVMELVVRAEEKFGIEVEELDIDKIGVFGSLCEIIAKETAK